VRAMSPSPSGRGRGEGSFFAFAFRYILVPTVSVGMHLSDAQRRVRTAERAAGRPHAGRGNGGMQTRSLGVIMKG
jgi:hypothetical protein